VAITETLSVRLSPETRKILAEAAPTHDAAGASALARDILEQWAAAEKEARFRESALRAVSYLREHPDWDDPADFFPGVKDFEEK
jgi:hypothetical protein